MMACGSATEGSEEAAADTRAEATTSTTILTEGTTESTAPSTTIAASTTTTSTAPTTTSIKLPDDKACTYAGGRTSIEVPTVWEVGEVREIEVDITKLRTGEPAASSRTAVEARVIDVIGDEMSVEWTQETTSIAVDGVDVGIGSGVFNAIPNPRILYRVDDDGFWVDNIDELRAALIETWTSIDAGLDSAALEQTMQMFESMPDESLALLMAEEPQLLHTFDGLEIWEGERLEVAASLPNALGGRPFPAILTVELTTMRDDEDCAVVTMTTEPDPDQFIDILFPTIANAFDLDLDEMDPNEIEELREVFEVRNTVTLQFDAPAARVWRVEAEQRFSTPEETRIETKTLTDVTDRGAGD